jgi:hypothetical protein
MCTIQPVADELFHAANTDATTLVKCGCILCILEIVRYKNILTSHYMRKILNNANQNQMGRTALPNLAPVASLLLQCC